MDSVTPKVTCDVLVDKSIQPNLFNSSAYCIHAVIIHVIDKGTFTLLHRVLGSK